MHQQHIRPISTYDNLSASVSSTNTSKPRVKQQPLCTGESLGQIKANCNNHWKCPQPQSRYDNESFSLRGGSAFNGIKKLTPSTNQQLTTPAVATIKSIKTDQTAVVNEISHSIAANRAALSDAKSIFFGIKNCETLDAAVPPSVQCNSQAQIHGETSGLQAMGTTALLPDKSLRYSATYEKIPLGDIDEQQATHAVYMSTTVPQNMKGVKIAGRHTPTRNSLRHSRMIVVNNKNLDSIQETYSTYIRNLNWLRQLLILQLAIGLLIGGLAIWIFILAPEASILINPFLSGLSLVLASIAGLILLGRVRRPEYHRSRNSCHKVLLAESYVFSGLTLIFCCLALVCAAIEFAELTSTFTLTEEVCGSVTSSLLSFRNCTCAPVSQQATVSGIRNEDSAVRSSNNNNSSKNCMSIRREWKYLLGFSMALNTLGIFATFLYITIFICCLRSSRKHFNTYI